MKPLFPKIKIILKIAETTGNIKGKPIIFMKMPFNIKLFLKIAFGNEANRQKQKDLNKRTKKKPKLKEISRLT